jgi:hypothetical protein
MLLAPLAPSSLPAHEQIPILRSSLAQFTILSFIATVLLALALAYALREKVVANALAQDADAAAHHVELLITPYLTPDDFSGLSAMYLRALDARVHNDISHRNTVHVKIWSPQGKVIYSDESVLIGQTFDVEEDLQQALGGTISTDVSNLDRPENVAARAAGDTRLLEICVPIYLKRIPQVLSAYEIYQKLDAIQPRLDELTRYVYGGVALGFLVLYVAFFKLVRRGSVELTRRSTENARLAAQEQRRAQTHTQALEYIRAKKGLEFVPQVVDVFVEAMFEEQVAA